MAYRVNITPRAQRDLEDLYRAIAADRSGEALSWYRRFRQVLLGLSDYPRRCPATPESPVLRHLLFGRKPHIYRAIFRISEKRKEVEVLHIRHRARQTIKAEDLS
jgi:plasmid stabilization system protein ParE